MEENTSIPPDGVSSANPAHLQRGGSTGEDPDTQFNWHDQEQRDDAMGQGDTSDDIMVDADADAMFDELIKSAAGDMLSGVIPGLTGEDAQDSPFDVAREHASGQQNNEDDSEAAIAAAAAAAAASFGQIDAPNEALERSNQDGREGQEQETQAASTSAPAPNVLDAQEQSGSAQQDQDIGSHAQAEGSEDNEEEQADEEDFADLDAQAAAMLGSAIDGFDFGAEALAPPKTDREEDARDRRMEAMDEDPKLPADSAEQEQDDDEEEREEDFDEDAIARFAAQATSSAFAGLPETQDNAPSGSAQTLNSVPAPHQDRNAMHAGADEEDEEEEEEEEEEEDDEGEDELSKDIERLAQQALGLDENGNPLPGTELAKAAAHEKLASAITKRAQNNVAVAAAQAQAIGQPSTSAAASSTSKAPSATQTGKKSTTQKGKVSKRKASAGGPSKRFRCDKCERAFARAYNLHTHQGTHDPNPARSKPFSCPYPSCQKDGGRSFSRKHDLQRHVTSCHETEQEPAVVVQADGSVVPIAASNPYEAGGKLVTEHSLERLGLGTPGRRFRCDRCGKAFVRRDALTRHNCDRTEMALHRKFALRPPPYPHMYRPMMPLPRARLPGQGVQGTWADASSRHQVSPAAAAAAAAAIAAAAAASKGHRLPPRPPLGRPPYPRPPPHAGMRPGRPPAFYPRPPGQMQPRPPYPRPPAPRPQAQVNVQTAAPSQQQSPTEEDEDEDDEDDDEAQRLAEQAAAAMFSSVNESLTSASTPPPEPIRAPGNPASLFTNTPPASSPRVGSPAAIAGTKKPSKGELYDMVSRNTG